MSKPVQQKVRGKWGPGTAGGCPRVPTWTKNPQYLLSPTAGSASASFTIALRCNASPRLDIGFLVLHQSKVDGGGRKLSEKVRKNELIHKTTWKQTDVQTAELQLTPPTDGTSGVIIVPCTFEAGHQAAFELTVSSDSGAAFALSELSEAAAPAGAVSRPVAQPLQPTATNIDTAASGTPVAAAKAASTLSGVPPGAAAPASTAAPIAAAAAPLAPDAPKVAENEVQSVSEGQGLSRKQQLDAAELTKKALAACEASGGPYVDPDFPAGPSSLWSNGSGPGDELQAAGLTSDPVVSWRRPSEFGAPLAPKEGPPRLFYQEYGGVQGVVASSLLNHWLLAACNIVGGDIDILEKTFVDHSHADKGFYLVRFYVDDPKSDDDWQVVLVDDQLPCGRDGLPCFAHCPTRTVLWLPILEKAFAKFKGSYEATSGGSVEDGLLYLTGGLSREHGVVQSSDAHMVDLLWNQMMEWWKSNHVVGCEHRIDSEPSDELTATGLLANLPYCVVTGGEPNGQRMVRLRTFHGYSEWKGKWADGDPNWTSQLRQLMSYDNNNEDGTFWMAFEDFVLWFNVLFTCRLADDRWTRLTIRSKWQDTTAGGCCPNFATWRNNPQWLLTTSQPLRLTLSLSIPAPDVASTDHASLFPAELALGVTILKGNPGADAKRRRLYITEADELVVRAEPRQVRRLVQEVTLEPSETPYIVMPHTFAPGRETPFTLVVRCDDENDDGIPDFNLEPVRPQTDWHQGVHPVDWDKAIGVQCEPAEEEDDDEDDDAGPGLRQPMYAPGERGGAPGSAGFAGNPRIDLRVSEKGRFFVMVDQVSLSTDGRTTDGLDEGPDYPTIGVAVLASAAVFDDGQLDDNEVLQKEQSTADSVLLACELAPSDLAYCIVPYLEDPSGALQRHPKLQCRVCVYADVPFTLGNEAPEHAMTASGNCTCWNLGKMPEMQNEGTCPILKLYNSLQRMQRGLDRQLKYLDTLAAFPATTGYANKDGQGFEVN